MNTFAGASLQCNSIDGVTAQLVSVESRGEDDILRTQEFWERIPVEVFIYIYSRHGRIMPFFKEILHRSF